MTEGLSTLKRILGSTGSRCLRVDKTGETRLKCGEEPTLLCRTRIKPLNGTAVEKTELNFSSNNSRSNGVNWDGTRQNKRNVVRQPWNPRCNIKTVNNSFPMCDLYNHWRQKNTTEIYWQKSLRVKWKLTKSVFNLKSFVTVSILKSKRTAKQRPS